MLKSTETTETTEKEEFVQNDIVDIQLGSLRKQRFRINGDNTKILELNTSDLGIITRLSELYPKLQELADKAVQIGQDDTLSETEEEFKTQVDKMGSQLKEIDLGMRDYIDKLFDSNVSEVCAPYGTMYDVVNGQFRYDEIIDKLTNLYETNIEKETKALKTRLAKKVEKYLPQDRKRSTKRSK